MECFVYCHHGVFVARRAIYVVEGCGVGGALGALSGLDGSERRVFVEGGGWVLARLEVWGSGGCRVVRVGLRGEEGRRFWGDFFEVCVEEGGGGVVVSVRRVGGVGRVSADLLGGWLLEALGGSCGGMFVRRVSIF